MDFQTLVSGNFATYICKGSNNSLVILLKISSQRSDCCYSKIKKKVKGCGLPVKYPSFHCVPSNPVHKVPSINPLMILLID